MTTHRATRLTAARRLLASALAVAAIAACVDLDESARTFISPDQFYRDDAQAQQAINGVYAPLMGWNGWKSPAQYSLMCDEPDLLCWNWMSGGFSGQQAGQWYAQDNSVYMGDFQIIERANQVLAYVPASSGISADMKRIASGQALFARGYAYFDLVRRFGGVPLRTAPYLPNSTLGAQRRASPDSIWRQAAKDLREAAGMLPVDYPAANGRGLPRAASAWGLLAKVYLHMAGHEVDTVAALLSAASRTAYLDSARQAAQMVMGEPSVELEAEYMDLFDINKQNTSREILFAIQGAAVNNSGSQVPAYFGPRGDCTVVGSCGQGFLSLREDFIRSFADSLTDKRVEHDKAIAWSWEITQSPLGKVRAIHLDSLAKLSRGGLVAKDVQFRWDTWNEGCGAFQQRYDTLAVRATPGGAAGPQQVVAIARPYYTLKYVDRQHLTTDQAAANNFIILRHADVLLTFAEAQNRLSPGSGTAIAALNQVRARANVRLFPSPADTIPAYVTASYPANARPINELEWAIWKERGQELYAEFQTRFDMIRQGRWLAEMNRASAVPDFAGHGACKPRQAYQLLQNIPNKELAANPLMTQNSGY